MKHFFNQIKWAYQRVIQGYDDTIYWSFDDYFSQFIKPLQKFCKDELVDTIDERRIKIFTETLKLIDNYREMTYMDNFEENDAEQRLWEYVGKNLAIYWN